LIENSISQNYIAYIQEVEQLLQNIKITSNTSFTWGDQICEISNATEQINSDENNVRVNENLTALLVTYLYQLKHCRQSSIDENTAQYQNSFDVGNRVRNFVELLSRANNSVGNWEPGWLVYKLEKNGKIAVKKNDLVLWVLPHQFALLDNKQARIGDKCYVAMVKEFRELLPGYYMANGNTALKEQPFITRIYWNISSNGAISLLKSLTTELNRENIPFQFKILKNEDRYTRADAGVLYMDKGDIRTVVNALSTIYDKIKSFLKPSVPLFTKRLVPGISLAEDPSNGESFGQNRTRLFAEAIYDIHSKNISVLEDKVRQVRKYFKTHKVDFNKPYLKNAESKDEYDEVLVEFLSKINE
jgi:HopA1 effector protein family